MTKQKIISVSLCIIILITLLSGSILTHASDTTINADASTHLINLNIMDSTYWQDENAFVNRQEFAKLICNVSNPSIQFDATVFSDVPADSEFYNDIEYCVFLGLMSGYNDGTFRPSQPISVIEAAKVLVVLAGYGPQAYYEGGYPFGYSSMAWSLDLFSKAKVYDENAFVTRSQLAQIIYNTLLCRFYSEYMFDNSGNVYFERTGETVAEHYLGLKHLKGVMKSNGILVVDDVKVSNNTLLIGNTELLSDRYEFKKFVGHSVECFYDKNTKTARSVVSDKQKTKTLTIRGVDISTVEKNIIKYNDVGKREKVDISDDALFLLNGSVVLDYDLSRLIDKSNAELYLVSNDSSNSFKLVFINIYDEMVVGSRSSNGIIADLFNSLNTVDIAEKGAIPTRIVDEKGNVISYGDIARNNIISVMEGVGFSYVRVSKQCLGGIFERKAKDYITVDGEDYVFAENCRATIDALVLGSHVKIYVNASGVITNIVNDGGDSAQFGYLYKAGLQNGISQKLELMIFTTDGEMKIYSATDKLKIDDTTVRIDELNNLPPQLQNLNCLIGFTADEEGTIRKIDLPADAYGSGESTFYHALDATDGKVKYHATNSIIDGKHIIGSDTVIMQIPTAADFDNEDEFMIFTKSALHTSNYAVDVYYYSSLNEFCDVVIFHGASQKMVLDSYIGVLSSLSIVTDEDGYDVNAATYMSKNEEITTYIPEDLLDDFEKMGEGDVFRFSVNSNGYFSDINWIYDLSTDEVKNTVGDDWSDGARIVTKYVAKVGASTLRLSDEMESYNDSTLFKQEVVLLTSPYITVVEDDGSTIREGTVSDLSEGSKIVMYQRSTTPRAIVVFVD